LTRAHSHKSPVYTLYILKRDLCIAKRALIYCEKEAESSILLDKSSFSQEPVYTLYILKRALYILKRALYILKRALTYCEQEAESSILLDKSSFSQEPRIYSIYSEKSPVYFEKSPTYCEQEPESSTLLDKVSLANVKEPDLFEKEPCTF